MNYMQHVCKNNGCGKIFLAVDLYNRITPEAYRYCPECEVKGFPKIRSDTKNEKMVRVSTFKKHFERQKHGEINALNSA